MAGRLPKYKADYFPHYAQSGKTVFILEQRFGNDGYVFWFKLLELLCISEHHYFRCGNSENWQFLLSKMRISENTATEIIDVLISLGKLDEELWESARILRCQKLIDNLDALYNKRSGNPLTREFLLRKYSNSSISVAEIPISAAEMQQTKLNKTKREESTVHALTLKNQKLETAYDAWRKLWNECHIDKFDENSDGVIFTQLASQYGCCYEWLSDAVEHLRQWIAKNNDRELCNIGRIKYILNGWEGVYDKTRSVVAQKDNGKIQNSKKSGIVYDDDFDRRYNERAANKYWPSTDDNETKGG